MIKPKICRRGPTGLWAGYAPDVLYNSNDNNEMIKNQKLSLIQLQEKRGWVGVRKSSTNNVTFFTYDSSLISPSITNKIIMLHLSAIAYALTVTLLLKV